MPFTTRRTRRSFISNGLAVSGGLALGGSRAGFAAMQTAAAPAAALVPEPASITGKNSLKAHAARKGLLTGAAVEAQLLNSNPAIAQIVVDQYSILVAENSMKVGPMRPTPNTYSFDAGDALVAFGDAHGIKVRGHNLCWHSQLPTWFNSYVTKDNARQILVDHITTVVSHYKGKLHSWDVVNEAINVPDGQPGGLRNGPWYKLLPDFIPIAFRAARAADPDVLLTYNDYGIETDSDGDTKKRAAILELVRGMQADKVPINAVGIQSHIHTSWTPDNAKGFREWMATLRGMGLKLFATELDINDDTMDTTDPAEIDAAVAKVYHDYLDMLMNEPAVAAVITWGVTDAHTWLAGRRPGGPRPPGMRPPGQGGQPGAQRPGAPTQPAAPPAQAAVQPLPAGGADVQPPGPPPGQVALHRAPERPLAFDADNKPKSAFFAIRDAFDTRKT
jgi:endo-1,4-beta-xylanase